MSEDTKERLRTARAELQKLQQARDEANDLRELQECELILKYEKELGPRGREFELVSTQEGPIVIRRGEFVLYKAFQESMVNRDQPSPEAVHSYVSPCVVFPSREAFNKIVDERPHYAVRCANALLLLHGAKEITDRGKF